jgi:succinate dehydrogenase hydrophobic anchor subunit
MTAAKQLLVTRIIWGAIASVVVGFGAAAAVGAVAFMLLGDSGSVGAAQIGFVYGPAAAFMIGALATLLVAISHGFNQYKQPVREDQVSGIRTKFWLSVAFMTLCIVAGAYYYYGWLSLPPTSSGVCQVDSQGNCLPGSVTPAN